MLYPTMRRHLLYSYFPKKEITQVNALQNLQIQPLSRSSIGCINKTIACILWYHNASYLQNNLSQPADTTKSL